MKTNSEIEIVAKGAGKTGLANIVGNIFLLISNLVIARIIGASNFGLIAIAISFIGILKVFSVLGTDIGIIKFIANGLGNASFYSIKRLIRKTLIFVLISSILIIAIVILFLNKFEQLFFPSINNIDYVIKIILLVFPLFSILFVEANILSGIQEPQYLAISNNILIPILRVGLLTLLLVFFTKLDSILYATVLAYAIAPIYLLIVIKHKFKSRLFAIEENIETKINFKLLLSFSLPLTLIPLLNLSIQRFDILFVGHFLNASLTGIYVIVKRVGELVIFPLAVFGGIVSSSVPKLLSAKDYKQIQSVYFFSTKWISITSSLIFIIIFSCSRHILNLFGEDFIAGDIALKFYILGQLVNASVGNSGTILIMMEKKNLVILNSILGMVLSISIILFAVPRYGLAGAAFAISSTVAIINILSAIQLKVILKLSPQKIGFYFKSLLAILIIIILNKFILLIFPLDYSLGPLLIIGLVTTVLLLGFFRLTNLIDLQDIHLIKRYISKVLNLKFNFS